MELMKLARTQENLLLCFPLKNKVSEIIDMLAKEDYGSTRKLKYNLPKKYRYKIETETGERFLVNLKGLKVIPYKDLFKTIHTADVLNNHPSKEKLRQIVSSISGNITKDMVSWYRENVCYHCMAVDNSRKFAKQKSDSTNPNDKSTFTSEFKHYTAQIFIDTQEVYNNNHFASSTNSSFLRSLDENIHQPTPQNFAYRNLGENEDIDSHQITDACGVLMNLTNDNSVQQLSHSNGDNINL